jgi:hypothetical protein
MDGPFLRCVRGDLEETETTTDATSVVIDADQFIRIANGFDSFRITQRVTPCRVGSMHVAIGDPKMSEGITVLGVWLPCSAGRILSCRWFL